MGLVRRAAGDIYLTWENQVAHLTKSQVVPYEQFRRGFQHPQFFWLRQSLQARKSDIRSYHVSLRNGTYPPPMVAGCLYDRSAILINPFRFEQHPCCPRASLKTMDESSALQQLDNSFQLRLRRGALGEKGHHSLPNFFHANQVRAALLAFEEKLTHDLEQFRGACPREVIPWNLAHQARKKRLHTWPCFGAGLEILVQSIGCQCLVDHRAIYCHWANIAAC